MIRCKRCGIPDTRPGAIFKDGVCLACLNYDRRKGIDWKHREQEFKGLCAMYRRSTGYDCVVAVSGGKDSYFIVKKALEEGMHPLLVTVTDSFTHTKAGVHNLRNLITWSKCNHLQYTINHDLFIRATRWAFEQTGEALKFVEYAIYTVPVRIAYDMGIELVFFGENSAYEYGSTAEEAWSAIPALLSMESKMEQEIRWWERGGIMREELQTITLPLGYPEVVYTSYYFPWSSVDHLKVAQELGFHTLEGEWDREGTIENFEQIDSMAYMVHLWLKYPKFGFQRVSDIASRRVREGLLSYDEALKLIRERDSDYDFRSLADFCDTCGYTLREFWHIVNTADWNRYARPA